MIDSSQHVLHIAGWRVNLEINAILCVLSEGKHLLMCNVQLCLIFEIVSFTLKFPLHSAIVTIVQKSSA